MNIIICDDDSFFCHQLEKYVDQVFSEFGSSYKCEIFYNGEGLLSYLKKTKETVQIYLLDIEMTGMNGLQLAAKIRAQDAEAIIIFVTNHDEEMPNAFDVQAFHYLVKPLNEEKVLQVLIRAKKYLIGQKKLFHFTVRQQLHTLPVSEIEFFSSEGRKVIIHMKNGESCEYYDTLDEVEEQLGLSTFFRIHKSYLINVEFLSRVDGNKVIVKSGSILPISKRYRGTFHQSFRELLLEM